MREHIHATSPFERLPEDTLAVLENAGEWKTLASGEQLFAFGDQGDAMYIVVEGRLQALIPGKQGQHIVVAELGPHHIIGEIQLLTGGKRSATVRSVTPARLIRFPKVVFDRLTQTEPEAVAEINGMILRRLRGNQLAGILTGYFGPLPPGELEQIASQGEWLQLRQGQALFRRGAPANSLYILVSGGLGVLRGSDGNERMVGRIRPGELVGEMALLTDESHSATVYAIREAELVRFSKAAFFALLEEHPRFLLQITRTNIGRLREVAGSAEPEAATTIVSLLPAPGAPIAKLARQLAAELAAHYSVLHLNSADIDGILEMPGVSQAPRASALGTRFSAWLSAQEGSYRFILLETDPTRTNWTERCIQQSDQAITVASGGTDPAPGEVEALLYSGEQRGALPKRLVLIHPDDCPRPSGTGRWLERRQVEMHHHVRLGNPEDVRRLARFVSGRAVCLALGGGGARGFAHIGAFRALEEAGVPVDLVGGTSMGAVVGAEFALGLSPDQMTRVNKAGFRNLGLLFDLTLPLLSFTTGRVYAGTLKRVFGDVAIEDLWIPYFCVSSNISRARMAVHRTGLLRQKVRASSGVQGLFPPMVMDGDLHVDGALFSNLPADVMKSVCRGKVIAVDVTPPVDLSQHADYGDTISGWTVLRHRLFPGAEPFQSVDLGTIMQRSAEAASMANQRRVIETMADFYLQMPVQQFNLMNFGAIEKVSEIGYLTAKQKIAEWKRDPRW